MRFVSRSVLSLCAGLLLIGGALPARADRPTFTQTFDVPGRAPCEGLVLDGVRYSYTEAGEPSFGCFFGDVGPTTENVAPPLIQFVADGVLTLRFDVPTTSFGFGAALLASQPEPRSVVVELFGPGIGRFRDELALDTTVNSNFIGGRFEYRGPAVRTVTIRVGQTSLANLIAIDNITYARPPGRNR